MNGMANTHRNMNASTKMFAHVHTKTHQFKDVQTGENPGINVNMHTDGHECIHKTINVNEICCFFLIPLFYCYLLD